MQYAVHKGKYRATLAGRRSGVEGVREPETGQEAQVVAMRERGASWKEIEAAFGLTRQQARYAFQKGKREERRAQRRSLGGRGPKT